MSTFVTYMWELLRGNHEPYVKSNHSWVGCNTTRLFTG